jgi:hypothetical protein
MDRFSKIPRFLSQTFTINREKSEKKESQVENPVAKRSEAAEAHITGQFRNNPVKDIKSEIFRTESPDDATYPALSEKATSTEGYRDRAEVQTLGMGDTKKIPIRDVATSTSDRKTAAPDDKKIHEIYPEPESVDLDLTNFIFNSKEYDEYHGEISAKGLALASAFNLTENEAAAIRAYTCDYYADINYQLRNLPDPDVDVGDSAAMKNSGVNPDMADLIANIVNGMKKLPHAQTDTNYIRGLGRDVNLPSEELAKYQEGAILSMSMFTSSTSTLQQMVDSGQDLSVVFDPSNVTYGRQVATLFAGDTNLNLELLKFI